MSSESMFGPRNRLRAIEGIFDAAYRVADHLEFTEPNEAVTALQLQKLQSFVTEAMAFRYHRQVITGKRFSGLHVASPTARIETKLYDFERPHITFSLRTLQGTDTKGDTIVADGLTVYGNEDDIDFVRVLRGDQELTPTRLRYSDALLSEIRSDFDQTLAAESTGLSLHDVQGVPFFE